MAGAPLGNKNASKENRLWAETIRRALVQGKAEKLRALAEKLISRAEEGDISALKEIGDRLDGKPVQSIAGDMDVNLTVEIVKFAGKAA